MASLITGNHFDPNKDIGDLSGKVYVVTGATAGIGFGIAAHILQHGPEKLYLLGKKAEHIAESQKKLEEWGDVSKVEFIQCELEDFKHTDGVARSLSKLSRLDGLVLNAGLGVGSYSETRDEIDSHMQVNIFAQAHIALTLLPLLLSTPNSRPVLQSSDLHRAAPSDTQFATISEMNRDIGPSYLYNRTKLAQILFVRALVSRLSAGKLGAASERFAQQGPWINATHPGGVSTDQQKQAEEAYGTMGKIGVALVRPLMKDPVDEGCRPALWATVSGEVEKDRVQGSYVVPDKKVTEPSSQAKDEALAERLWNLTMEVIQTKLGTQSYMQ